MREIISSLLMFFCFLSMAYNWTKEHKKYIQLKNDYDSLIETVKILTHENNILKNQSADTK